MASLPAKIIKPLFRVVMKRDIQDPEHLVCHLRKVMNAPLLPALLPSGVSLRYSRVADIPGQWLTTATPTVTLLFLHGGAFVGGRLDTYHNFCGRLAQALNARIFLADYRLAPEHPYPAAPDDALCVYRELIEDSRPLVVAGDSAGGNLTLVTLLRARDEGLPMPVCAIAISPGADATGELMSRQANNDSDPMLSQAMIDGATKLYLQGADPLHPYASPCRGDYRQLPPLMLTVSEEECLRDDAYAVAERARQAGVPVKLLSRPDMPHVWPILRLLLPEARKDTERLINFVQAQLRSAPVKAQNRHDFGNDVPACSNVQETVA
ncbi:MAG TPA: alpha/beta hydrolase [Gammaproteobacteria bacterium]|jgi:epsilon-lactone hydrolase|nr:alpha/beta hydrolase [Gammaproteobacteria bacterium]|tara:strand:+ start:10791 stop:11759 length:969 start_codon:yes stop_codon:yes gene_type:complete